MARPSRHSARDRAGGPPRQSRLRSASFTERGVHLGLARAVGAFDGGGNGAVPRVSDIGLPPVRKPSLGTATRFENARNSPSVTRPERSSSITSKRKARSSSDTVAVRFLTCVEIINSVSGALRNAP